VLLTGPTLAKLSALKREAAEVQLVPFWELLAEKRESF
jgi:hypothetical protein